MNKKNLARLLLCLALAACLYSFSGCTSIQRLVAEKQMPQDKTEYRGGLIVEETADELVYWEIYEGLLHFETVIRIDSSTPDSAMDIFYTVLDEHPEIYWADSATLTSWSRNDRDLYGELEPNYSCTQAQQQQFDVQIDAYVTDFLAGAGQNWSDYDKALYTYDYLINKTDYNTESLYNQNICSVFIYQESVCGGYAAAYQYLLNELDIPCAVIKGTVEDDTAHAWNLVCLEGEYYYVDVTWGEIIFDDGRSSSNFNHKFFGVTKEYMDKTHVFADKYSLPDCTAEDCNYYVREGRLLDSYDAERLAAIMQDDYSQGLASCEVRFSNEEAYRTAGDELFINRQVFDLLDRAGIGTMDTVSHISDDDYWIMQLIFR